MTTEERLAAIEARLRDLEIRTGSPPPVAPTQPVDSPWARDAASAAAAPVAPVRQGVAAASRAAEPEGSSMAKLLGIGGVVALLLAASYLVRLAVVSGWLTPVRQIALAAALGLGMIVAGLALKRKDRQYASILPAGGLGVLYLAIYSAHLVYTLITAPAVVLLIGVTSIGALALGRSLHTDVYALLAAVTSYSVPILLADMRLDPIGLSIYFCAWSLVYSAFSLMVGKRVVYLIALYLGLSLFATLPMTEPAWVETLVFQTLQLVIFGVAAAMFSIKTRRAMSDGEALAHAPALLFFYVVQYGTLQQHRPELAPVVAVLSAVVVVALYLVTRPRLPERGAAECLISGYVALVAFHAGFMEMVPDRAAPLVALAIGPAVAYPFMSRPALLKRFWPLTVAAAAVFAIGFVKVLHFVAPRETGFETLVGVLFAVELYVAYAASRQHAGKELLNALLYAGHVQAANSCILLLDDRLLISVAWAVLAFVTLGLGIRTKDQDLGRSALLILAFMTGKVMLFDLSGAQPVIRILCLVVLGVTLYGAGWVYQKLVLPKRQ